MKIEIRDSNPALTDPPLEVWLCPTIDGRGVVLMGHRGNTTQVIARLTEAGLGIGKLPEGLGLQRTSADRVPIIWD